MTSLYLCRNTRILMFLILAFGICGQARAADQIKLAMGAAPMEFFKKIEAPFKEKTGISLVFLNDKTGLGGDVIFKMVDTGIAEGGATGVSFEDWLQLMKEKHYAVNDPKIYFSRNTGKGVVKVFTNKANPLKKLTKAQLKDIFTGVTKNWKEVGGPDLPILLVMSTRQPATGKTFSKIIMDDKDLPKDVKSTGDVGDMIAVIAQEKGAIGFAPAYLATSTVNVPEIPDISRPYTFMTKGQPSQNMQKLFDFIDKDAQKYL
jgi:phosphate transport system substrate-binding protein